MFVELSLDTKKSLPAQSKICARFSLAIGEPTARIFADRVAYTLDQYKGKHRRQKRCLVKTLCKVSIIRFIHSFN